MSEANLALLLGIVNTSVLIVLFFVMKILPKILGNDKKNSNPHSKGANLDSLSDKMDRCKERSETRFRELYDQLQRLETRVHFLERP